MQKQVSPVSTVEFIKNVFYKTCFCIGLGTASYYSYGQVQHWVAEPTTSISSQSGNSGLQEKVDTLLAGGSAGNSAGSALMGLPTADQNPASAGYRANTKLYLIPGKKAAPPTVATASPAAAAVAGTEEKKDGEKKDEVAKTEEEGGAPAGAADPGNPLGLPFYPAPQATADQQAAAAAAAAENPNAAALAAASGALASGGIPTSGAGAAGGDTSPTSYGGSVPTPTAATNNGTAGAVLSATEIAQLTGTTIKATITESTQTVNGQVCTYSGSAPTNCVANNGFSVYTDRWNETYGLSTEATFSIIANGASGVKVNVGLQVQSLSQSMQTLSSSVSPTEVTTTTEVKNGVTYKVYDLKLPNLTGLNGEKLTNVTATLAYSESTTAGATATLGSDSVLTFTRSQVQTTETPWDLTTNRAPAANDPVVIANTMSYTVTLGN